MSKDRLASKCGRSQAAHEEKSGERKEWGWSEMKHQEDECWEGNIPPKGRVGQFLPEEFPEFPAPGGPLGPCGKVTQGEGRLCSILFRTQRLLSLSFQSQWCHNQQHREAKGSPWPQMCWAGAEIPSQFQQYFV